MSTFTLHTHVSDIVSCVPQTADLFRSLRIDFCCGGQITLEAAAAQRGLDPEEVLSQVKLLQDKFEKYQERRPASLSAPELIEHIQHKHHAFLRDELPALTPYVTKLARVHGERHPELLRVQELFSQLKKELLEHTQDEEQNVFPLMVRVLTEPESVARKQLLPLITGLEEEHSSAGGILQELREVTNDWELPDNACGTYRLVYQRLADLEKDTYEHIHLENNVLFQEIRKII